MLGKVNRVKEIRRRRKDGLKINRQQLFVRKKVSRAVGEGEGWEESLGRRGRSSYGDGGRGLRSCCPTTSQYLGPPGSWFLLEPYSILTIISNILGMFIFITQCISTETIRNMLLSICCIAFIRIWLCSLYLFQCLKISMCNK